MPTKKSLKDVLPGSSDDPGPVRTQDPEPEKTNPVDEEMPDGEEFLSRPEIFVLRGDVVLSVLPKLLDRSANDEEGWKEAVDRSFRIADLVIERNERD